MAEYRYYLIPDFMSYVFPQQFEEQAPTEFFSNTADLMKRYQQLREIWHCVAWMATLRASRF